MASSDNKDQPKIKVYWLNESRAQRILWLLEELNLEYEVDVSHRDKNMLAPPELKKIHPLGKAPIVTITPPTPPGSSTPSEPIILAESGFIMQYLSDHFAPPTPTSPSAFCIPARLPPDSTPRLGGENPAWLRNQYFLHYSEGSLQPTILVSLVLTILKSPLIPFFIRPITSLVSNRFFSSFVIPHITADLEFLESRLETAPDGGGYICGNHLTPADIMLSFPLELVRTRIAGHEGSGAKALLDRFPKLWAYLERLKGEEGYKKADKRAQEEEKKAVKGEK